MLRNLLYSLFLHFIVLVLIYLNTQSFYYYNLQTLFDKKGKPVKVSLIDVSELNKNDKQPLPKEPIIKKEQKKEPIIKEKAKIIPAEPVKAKEPEKKAKISTEKIVDSVKQENTKTEEAMKNYEYVKKPDSPPIVEDVILKEENKEERKDALDDIIKEENKEERKDALDDIIKEENKEEYKNTLDDIINETVNLEDVEDSEVYADESEAVEMEMGDDMKNVINLSIREKANIQRQIRGCYKMAILRSGVDSTTKVTLRVSLKKDGNINMKEVIVLNEDKYAYKNEKERESFEIAVENAKTALVFCSPLRNLSGNKYKVWKEMSLEFDSNKIEVVE